jgi:uncharacterized membrane protein YdjX (TVP38/TMEM64 family)
MNNIFSRTQAKGVRLAFLAMVLITLYLVGREVMGQITVENLRTQLEASGPMGVVLFLAAFAIGNLIALPGLLFVIASLLAYGKLTGFFIAVAGSLLSISISFWVVRTFGGQVQTQNRFIRWALGPIERYPIRTVAFLRTIMVLSPPVNYALALSKIRYRHYLLGSAAGLAIPLLVYAVGLDCVMATGILG